MFRLHIHFAMINNSLQQFVLKQACINSHTYVLGGPQQEPMHAVHEINLSFGSLNNTYSGRPKMKIPGSDALLSKISSSPEQLLAALHVSNSLYSVL